MSILLLFNALLNTLCTGLSGLIEQSSATVPVGSESFSSQFDFCSSIPSTDLDLLERDLQHDRRINLVNVSRHTKKSVKTTNISSKKTVHGNINCGFLIHQIIKVTV